MTAWAIVRLSIEAAAFAAGVGLVCRAVPRLAPSHKAILWWLVSAKLLVGLVPLPAVTVAALPATPARAVVAGDPPAGSDAATVTAPTSPAAAVSPGRVAIWFWLTGCACLSLAAIPEGLRVRRWVRAGLVLDDDASRLAIERARCHAGLRRAPRVLAVAGLGTPLVTGLLRPVVLLPSSDVDRLEPRDLEMALAHEMAHVARGDLWLGLVPALARRMFFFHPAAWLAEREFAIAREAACDEAVLGRRDADAFAYGRLLLRLAVRRPPAMGMSMSPQSMLRRRLEMIDTMMRRVPVGRAGWVLVAVAALAIVPVRVVAKESAPNRCLGIGSGRDTAYVITDGSSRSMCGDIGDVRAADAQRGNHEDIVWFRVDGQEWVVRDPAVVAEARRVFEGVSRVGQQQAEIGAVQSRLGAEQSSIGLGQSRAGLEQAAAAQREAERAKREADEELRRAARQDADGIGSDEAIRSRQEAMEKRMAELAAALDKERAVEAAGVGVSAAGERVDAANARMEELAARMAELGKKQAALGEQQRVLEERLSGELEQAKRDLSTLLERAMRDGTAEMVM
jgi:bla regulator protein BlaR1